MNSYEKSLRDDAIIEWVEPWPGKKPDGAEVHVAVTQRASAKACVMLQMASLTEDQINRLKETGHLNPADLLGDFMATHWAGESVKSMPGSLRHRSEFIAHVLECCYSMAAHMAKGRSWKEDLQSLVEHVDSISRDRPAMHEIRKAAEILRQLPHKTA